MFCRSSETIVITILKFLLFQDFSRTHNIDFEDLHILSTVVPDEDYPVPEGSIMLRNLSVVGGIWDYQLEALVDLSPNSNTVNK